MPTRLQYNIYRKSRNRTQCALKWQFILIVQIRGFISGRFSALPDTHKASQQEHLRSRGVRSILTPLLHHSIHFTNQPRISTQNTADPCAEHRTGDAVSEEESCRDVKMRRESTSLSHSHGQVHRSEWQALFNTAYTNNYLKCKSETQMRGGNSCHLRRMLQMFYSYLSNSGVPFWLICWRMNYSHLPLEIKKEIIIHASSCRSWESVSRS